MPEYTLSGEALAQLLVESPSDPERQGPQPIPWLSASLAAQLALLQVKVLQDLKTRLPAEIHGVLDEEIQMALTLDPKALKWDYCPEPPPRVIVIPGRPPIPWPVPTPHPAPGPNPPPGPLAKLGLLDRAVIAAHYLRAAHLHPAVSEQGDALMQQAVRHLNTGRG